MRRKNNKKRNRIDEPSRRDCLKYLGAGASAGLASGIIGLPGLAQAVACDATNDARLLFVWLHSGCRSADMFDHYGLDTQVEYLDPKANQKSTDSSRQVGTQDWYFPPAAVDFVGAENPKLTDFPDQMCLLRHVNFQTASHSAGQRFGTIGVDRPTNPTVASLVSNHYAPTDTNSCPSLTGIGVPVGTQSGGLLGQISAEWSNVDSILGYRNLTTSSSGSLSARDKLLYAALDKRHSSKKACFGSDSLVHEWQQQQKAYRRLDPSSSFTSWLVAENVGGDVTLQRMAAGIWSLISNKTRVAVVTPALGFDTHEGNKKQESNCKTLGRALAWAMDVLNRAPAQDDGLPSDRATLDNTIIVCATDVDRTPELNSLGGTDHWPSGCCFVAGRGAGSGDDGPVIGGVRGQYHGDPAASTTVYTRAHVYASILEECGVEYTEFLPEVAPSGVQKPKIFPGNT